MTNKTPYELRFDLLALARDTLETEYRAKMEKVQWQADYKTRFPEQNGTVDSAPTYPDNQTILTLAGQFKTFIEQK